MAIVGPTASGKSAVAEALAERFGASIVSVDSMQVYRRMDIGTAKPPIETRRRIRHRMIDLVDPADELTVREFQDLGRLAIDEEVRRAGRVVVCGGSGLHFRALVDPMTFAPTDADVRTDLEGEAPEVLRRRLEEVDPGAGDIVDLDNPRRVVRALEINALTGLTPSERAATPEARQLAAYEPVIDFVGFGFDPGDRIRERIERRLARMLEAGLLEEVASVADELGPTASQAVGYKELVPVVKGERDPAEGVARVIEATAGLVKRQRTWFRRDPRITWLPWQDGRDGRIASAVRTIGEAAAWNS